MNNYLRVGKIVNTRGIKGELKILPLTDDIHRFDDLVHVYLEKDNNRQLTIEKVSYHKKCVYIKFESVDSVEVAEKFKDLYIQIDRKDAIELDEGSYFICDLIGLKVYEEDKLLGEIKDVLQTGANDVYIVGTEGRDLLIPAIKDVVLDVNIKKKVIKVKLQEILEQ